MCRKQIYNEIIQLRYLIEKSPWLSFLVCHFTLYFFQNLENEISSRDALTKTVLSTGQKLVRGGHSASHKIMEHMKELEASVENLKAEARERRQRLMQSYEAHRFLTEVGMVCKNCELL